MAARGGLRGPVGRCPAGESVIQHPSQCTEGCITLCTCMSYGPPVPQFRGFSVVFRGHSQSLARSIAPPKVREAGLRGSKANVLDTWPYPKDQFAPCFLRQPPLVPSETGLILSRGSISFLTVVYYRKNHCENLLEALSLGSTWLPLLGPSQP